MFERKIRLSSGKDVTQFVQAAENCRFNIDVFYNRVLVDGKSILGMLGLDLSKVLTVRYDGQNEAFEKVLDHFAVNAVPAA